MMYLNLLDKAVATWRCDRSRCHREALQPVGGGLPQGWEHRGPYHFCDECALDADSDSQPRPTTSCVGPRRSAPGGQDGGVRLSPRCPSRERVAIYVLLSFALTAAVIALSILGAFR